MFLTPRSGDNTLRYDPTQFRQMIRQTTAVVDLPAGTSMLTFAKSDLAGGPTQPGVVDLDYVDVELLTHSRDRM